MWCDACVIHFTICKVSVKSRSHWFIFANRKFCKIYLFSVSLWSPSWTLS